jgi:hypothetical protein
MHIPLLKSQKNEIFEAIQKAGLDPRDFKWTERKSENNPDQDASLALEHRPSGYYYILNIDDDNDWWPEYSPGTEVEIHVATSELNAWRHKHDSIVRWLNNLNRETAAPDLWAGLVESETLSEAASAKNGDDTPFTPDEIKYIAGAMREIREYIISTHDLPDEMKAFVNDRIGYLEESSKRQDRKAWIHTTIGVLFTIIMGAAFSADAARELFRFAGSALSLVLRSQRLLP